MIYLREKFGFEKITLSPTEKLQAREQLKRVDENRINFIAFISLVGIVIILTLDFIFYTGIIRKYYLFIDFTLLATTVGMLFFSLKSTINYPPIVQRLKKLFYELFPVTLLLWSTSVCVLDPTSMINVITFYFVLFLLSFSIVSSPRKTIVIYVIQIIWYIILSSIINQPILSESFGLVILGCFLITPVYFLFRSIRFNSQAAIIKIDQLNKNLESEVQMRTKELLIANSNLMEENSRRKIIESKLRESLKQVELSNQLKSEFLANISHEIRTPLNSIIGFSEMLTEDSVSPERKKEFHSLIASNSMYLLSTIDDIFDASMLKTDQIKPTTKAFKLENFLESIFYETNGIELKYKKKDITLITSVPENVKIIIYTDEYFLKKALIRLIDNAYKFTEKGIIEIGARLHNKNLELYISDTGIGIQEKDQVKIFEPFVQGDGSFTRGYGGSGLGLTIVKGITRSIGANFSYNSTPNKGSVFIISFGKKQFEIL
jgi:signal transduction histidine kinase